MIRKYFQIEFRILNRKLVEFGVPPILGYLILTFVFFYLSNELFSRYTLANLIYIVICCVFLVKISMNGNRNNFIKHIFFKKDYFFIKAVSNLIVSTPFISFLLFKSFFREALSLIIVAFIFAYTINIKIEFIKKINTPFYKKPFEFIIGFRKIFLLIIVSYFITIMGVHSENLNLSIFAMLFLYFVIFNFLAILEKKYYIWNYSKSPKEFLRTKLKTTIKQASILILPMLIIMLIYYYEEVELFLFFYLLGLIYLISILLIKYSSYPNQINIPDYIVFSTSIFFPPLHFFIIPYYYKKSIRKLKIILND